MPEPAKQSKEKLVTLQQTREQKKSFESDFADWLVNEITVLGEAFGEVLLRNGRRFTERLLLI